MQRILNRTFDGLVMLREWPICEHTDRSEQTPDAFRIHDERPHVILRMGVGLEVRPVIAYPLSRRFVPPALFAVRIPRLPVGIARGAIVKDAPICRPRPRPVGENPHSR